MQRGSLLETARRDTQGGLVGGLVLMLVCAGVLALTWKYWDFNLFVSLAAPLFVFATVVTALAALRRMNLDRYPPIASLKRFGNPMQVVDAIEVELSSVRAAAYVSPLWIGPTWVVGLNPRLRIFKLAEIVAVAYVTSPAKKSKPPTYGVRFWVAGQSLSDTIETTEKEARAIIAALEAKVPGIVSDDATVFNNRWTRDRAACERGAKTRGSMPRSA